MSVPLFILGTLTDGDNHPYQIKKNLLDVLPVEKLSEGKFYYNFESLHKKGYIEPIETIHRDNRPNKTMYRITKTGRTYLEEEIYHSFQTKTHMQDLYIAIYLLKYVDPIKVAFLLEDSIQQEKKKWEKNRQFNPAVEAQFDLLDEKTKEAVRLIGEHAFKNAYFNIEWMEKLLVFIKNYAS